MTEWCYIMLPRNIHVSLLELRTTTLEARPTLAYSAANRHSSQIVLAAELPNLLLQLITSCRKPGNITEPSIAVLAERAQPPAAATRSYWMEN